MPCDCDSEERAAVEATVTRSVDVVRRTPEVLEQTITTEWAQARTDEQLVSDLRALRERLGELATDDDERPSVQSNIRIIERVQADRVAEQVGGEQQGGYPRPAGLPLRGSYQLIPIESPPPGLLDRIPDGELVELTPELLQEASGPAQPVSASGGDGESAGIDVLTYGAPGLAGAGGGMVAAQNSLLGRYGFAAAGENAIGIVATGRPPGPLSPLSWGHTAVYIRQNGVITTVRGFNPDMRAPTNLMQTLLGGVEEGTGHVPARITNDAGMFRSMFARSLEYPVPPEFMARMPGLPEPGMAGPAGAPEFYTARPAVYESNFPGTAGANSNCGLWGCGEVGQRLGGPVGRAGQGPIVDVGRGGTSVPRTAHQPEILSMIDEAHAAGRAGGPSPIETPPGAMGPAVAGRPSTGMQVLKVGGRIMLVVGVAAGAYEIATAAPEDRARTTVGVAGGFAGGFALGATAGLVCGPGAPVCSIVAGLTLGAIGGFGGRWLAESAFDAASSDYEPTGPSYQPWNPYDPAFNKAYSQALGVEDICPNCHSANELDIGSPLSASPGGEGGLSSLLGEVQAAESPTLRFLSDDDITVLAEWLAESPELSASSNQGASEPAETPEPATVP